MPNFYSINVKGFRRKKSGSIYYENRQVVVNNIIEIETSGTGAASAWTKTATTEDVFFVYIKRGYGCESSNHGPLPISLKTRGIYAIAKSTTDPYITQPPPDKKMAIKIKIIAMLKKPVCQYNINCNPLTYWATPYAGNRNDAIQRHPDATNQKYAPHPRQGIEFMKMIVKANPGLRNMIKQTWPFFNGKI